MSDEVGWYAYGIVPARTGLEPDAPLGVDPEFGVDVFECGDVAAMASRVRLSEFGAAALQQNLEDRAWLERTARAHDAVVAHAMGGGPVVPLRLCTVFTSTERLLTKLREQETFLSAQLERVRGRAEWAVKILLGTAVGDAAGQDAEGAPGAAPSGEGDVRSGRDYLARKRQQRVAQEDADAVIDAAVGNAHERLRHHATATAVLRPQNADLSGRRGRMVHNGAYLVEAAKADEFMAAAAELAEAERRRGLQFEVSGPWAPYNFVSTAGAAP